MRSGFVWVVRTNLHKYLGAREDTPMPKLTTGNTFVLRRARKAHRCKTHGLLRSWDHEPLPPNRMDIIPPTALYVEYLGETPAYQSGQRYCFACALAAGLVVVD